MRGGEERWRWCAVVRVVAAGVGPVHIIGSRRATGYSCLWLLPVSSAFGKYGRGTSVGRARLGSCYGCLDCCRSGLIGEVHALFYHLACDSVRTGGDRWLGRGWCVNKGGGRLEVGEYAGAGLVGFFCVALCVMVDCVGAE